MSKKIAYLFPGQGSQAVGVGQEFYEKFDFVRELFEMVSENCKLNIRKLCFNGPMEELTQTINLQPALTTVNLAFLRVLEKACIEPSFCAGHSLGEYSALVAAGFIQDENCVRLVYRRGQLMHRDAAARPGAMQAIIGLDIQTVTKLVEEGSAKAEVAVANHNTDTQIVITGSREAVQAVGKAAKRAGAKAIPLKVSGAWHSPLMRNAQADFADFLATIPFENGKRRIVLNVTAESETDGAVVKAVMGRQLCSPVRWVDGIRHLVDQGVEALAEVGPGNVLTGLARKIDLGKKGVALYNVNSLQSLEAFIDAAA